MKHAIFISLVFAWVALTATAVVLAAQGNNEFDSMVRAVEHRYNAHGTHIPMMGLVSTIARIGSKGAVGNVDVVTFENFNAKVDGTELTALVEEKLGGSWKRIIRETRPGSSEQTLIYARPEGKRMGLVVVDLDGTEMELVTVSVDPKHLQEEVAQYTHNPRATVGTHADKGSESNEDKKDTESASEQAVTTAAE
jgi:hypothetical protein